MKRIFSLAILAALTSPAFADEDKHESTTASVINHAIDKASDGLTQIAHALSSAAPQAWSLAVHGVYAKGLATLIVAAVFLVASAFFFMWCMIFGRKGNWDSSDITFVTGFSVLCGVASVAMFIFALCNAADGDSWARIISPDGYLAQSILTKALN